jgi:phosphatidylinositol kinase/protein kinase (PI-3  family)
LLLLLLLLLLSVVVQVFDSVLDRFKPVFHHFFLEQFPDPPLWFEHRLNYIRSVASSSILGTPPS